MALVKEISTKFSFGEKPYLGFERITMVPYCRRLIDANILTQVEKDWINSHHAEILSKTRGYFEKDEITMNWLKRETRPIE